MSNAPERILVINVARIGDTLLGTPVLRALATAYPEAELTVMTHPNRLELLRHLPFVHRLVAMTPRRAMWSGRLFGRRYSGALVFGHDAPLIRYALRVSDRVVAFRQGDDTLDRRLAVAVASAAGREHAVEERLRLAQAYGAPPAGRRLAYVVTEAETRQARQLLDGLFETPGAPLVGMQLHSFPTKAYRDWPRNNFAALIERLLATHPAARVVLLGGPESSDAAAAMAARFDDRVAVTAGRLGLRENAALMSLLDAYVGVDTGPTHLAGALGVPMVALYHCRHRGAHLAPLDHPRLRVIEHPANDAECSSERGMDEIAVDAVWQALLSLLDRTEEVAA